MDFWKMAYDLSWIDIDVLRQAVITETNPFGDISKEQFKEITGKDF
ncbi:XkdX family protein [Peptoniphilus raoultii]|nr:XkdX family protein [Peptoniphilus raoultii]